VERTAPSSAAAAEAQTLRLYLDNPAVELELESLVRAVATASEGSLGDVVGRARRLATEQGSWRGWMVVAIAEARRRRWNESRASLRIALEIAPGAAPAHLEMARVLLAMGRVDEARVHVQTAIACDGPSPRALELFSLAAAPASQRRGSAWLEPLRRIWKSCSTVARQRYVNRSS
jgi:Flp pilus assembly protein TadD